MDYQFMDEAAFGELIRRITADSGGEGRQSLKDLEEFLGVFHDYVHTVVRGETEIMTRGKDAEGQEYRDMISAYDANRHNHHDSAIMYVSALNRLAAKYKLPPVFTGDSKQRHQVADFCLEMDSYLFRNRRMIL